MYPLFESIRLENGEFQNLEEHLLRIERSSITILGVNRAEYFRQGLLEAPRPTDGVYKARLRYSAKDEAISYSPYHIKPVASLKVVVENDISYSHKFSDRMQIEKLMDQREQCDDIIIVKNNLVTDASFANLAFYTGGHWETPEKCLLPGVMRSILLRAGKIREAEITSDSLHKYEKVKLINAMVGWNGPEVNIDSITF